jgi:hypothetical protein
VWTPLHSPAAVGPYAQRVMLTSTIPKLGALPQNEMPLNSSPYTIYNTDYLFCHIPWWQELSAGSSSLVLSFPFLSLLACQTRGALAPLHLPSFLCPNITTLHHHHCLIALRNAAALLHGKLRASSTISVVQRPPA